MVEPNRKWQTRAKWIELGLTAIGGLIGDEDYCFTSEPGLAEIYLVPQLYVARRFQMALGEYPKILRVEKLAIQHDAFRGAHRPMAPE
ncbi:MULTISPECIES: hypothetical protein [unclassified Bradyrhizobium]|uniref:hypothetical protein n=1 Tax=unclassified Bradyrhizobium TaxID=2631580 RepID=UPI001FCB211D|nr:MULTISPECIES: hypothetical protein [unclassified Bradyrhizobium]